MRKTDDIVAVLRALSGTEKGITFVKEDEKEVFVSFRDLWNRSFYVKNLLEQNHVTRGSEVLMRCEDNEFFLYALWAGIIGGFIVIPMDASKGNLDLNLINYIVEDASKAVFITDSIINEKLDIQLINIKEQYEEIVSCGDYTKEEVISKPEDIFCVQYSSGTTDKPHGVIVTKENIAINVYDFIKHYDITESDRILSWSPLTHCFGLITLHIVPTIAGAEQCLMSSKLYMNKPSKWAELVTAYKPTRIGSIPFALKHFNNMVMRMGKKFSWDFSSVKTMFLAGEQVNFGVYKEFCDIVEPYGMGLDQIYPVYGLAESTVMVCSVPPGKRARKYRCMNERLLIGDKVQCEEVFDVESKENLFIEVGTKMEQIQWSVRDDEFRELPEEYLGNIYISGPSVTQGYYKDEESTKKVFKEEIWLNTGDVGFLKDKNLIIVGRTKELIVANGKKISCALIENVIDGLLETTPYRQCVVANGIDAGNESEQVIVFIKVEKKLKSEYELSEFVAMKRSICSSIFEKNGLVVNQVIPIEEIPKTSSGKTFRRKLTTDYNAGLFKNILERIKKFETTMTERVELEVKMYTKHMIETKIVAYMKEKFNITVSDYDLPISQYGIVSINIPAFVTALNEEFHINMKTGDIFSYFTVSKLTNHILKLLQVADGTAKVSHTEKEVTQEKLAIVGMSCRFPGGANSIDEYWDLLMRGDNGVSEVPEDRWDLEKYYDEDKTAPGKMYCKRGGFLDCDIKEFDARFFNISPKEANALDPQQRMLLELTWEAFENGNMDIEKYNGSNTGVYIGMCTNEYNLSQLYSGDLSDINAYSLTGTCFSTACGRVSYTFGFEGPCIAVDTACSSALTALHLACTAIQAGEADMQVIAGINLMESPSANIGFSKLQATSVDGYSKSFDASANGYGRGEGCGVIIVKRLSDAIRDKNQILGLIRATGINQDGKSNGLTAPNGESQEKLIRKTMIKAGISAQDVDYVEMHGTGTKLGDPIEVGAVGKTYGTGRTDLLKIGSVKSNIGHLEAAAGIASIEKVLLSMKYNVIPANLHFNEPNPLIDWENAHVKVIDKATPWEKDGVRMAAINGFGFGGSNAHIIIEEYKPEIEETADTSRQDGIDYILKVTAQSEVSLNTLLEEYIQILENTEDDKVEDFIYTANRGRADLSCRCLVCGSSRQTLIDNMKTYLEDGFCEGVISNVKNTNMYEKDRKAVFMFTGQGSQYVNMGKLLYENNETFRSAFDTCSSLFRPYLVKSLVDLVYSEKADAEVIARTVYAQPLIFAIEYALYKVWEEIGVKPEVVMGHSIGEYAAAVAANIMSLEDAVKLVSARGRLMDLAPGHGKMATIFASEDKINDLLKGFEESVCIAAKNAEETCVISGEGDDVEKVEKLAEEQGYKVKELTVSHAFHSMLMEPVLDDFYQIAKDVTYREGNIRFVSALYGREVQPGEILDASYWTRHIRAEVDFYKAVTSIENVDKYILLEVGSNRVLAALGKLIFEEKQIIASTLSIKKEDKEYLAKEIATVYASGVNVDWDKVTFAGKKSWKPVQLPNYPYDKKTYWSEMKYDRNTVDIGTDDYHPILGQRIELPNMNNTIMFQSHFTTAEPYFMREHIIFGASISPAAAHSAMLLTAIRETSQAKSCSLSKIEFRAPLAAKDDEERKVQIYIEKDGEHPKFNILSSDYKVKNDKWLLHAQGEITVSDNYECDDLSASIEEYRKLDFGVTPEESIYHFMTSSGFNLGEGFRQIKQISYGEGECVCRLEPLTTVPYFKEYVLYPGTIDSIFQTGIANVVDQLIETTSENGEFNKTVIPYYMEKITYNYKESKELWCHTKSHLDNDIIYADIVVYNEKGEMVFKLDNMMAKITDSNSLLREMSNLNKIYYHNDWMPIEDDKEVTQNVDEIQYVIVSDEEEGMKLLQTKFLAYQVKTVCVLAGKQYVKNAEDSYELNLEDKADWEKLLGDMQESGTKKNYQIIYANLLDKHLEESKEQIDYSNVKGLLYLVQVLNEKGYAKNTKIKVLTRNVQDIVASEETNLSGSMLWGLTKTVGIEYPQISCGIVDVDDDAMQNNEQVVRELLGNEVEEICICGTQRYTARLISHVDYLKKQSNKNKPIVLEENASYLITGGTGALGMVYAGELVKQGAKNLVLLCRRDPKPEVQEKIQEFMDNGVNVKVAHADVCDFENLVHTIKKLSEEMPEIRGVVHTAGVLNDKMIADFDWDEFVKVLQPKVQGTVNLYNALKGKQIDFFMMLSSITSMMGNMGQANYAAANYFMNTFAYFLKKNNISGYTFCWGPWSQSGMASGSEDISENMKTMGISTFDKEQGQMVLEDFFQQPYENLLIADVDWNILGTSLKSAAGKKEFLSKVMSKENVGMDEGQEALNGMILDELKALAKDERQEYLEDKLQEVCGKIMGFDKGQLSKDDAFKEQGADSLMIFSMRTAVNQILGTDLNVSVFFNYPSISKLTEHVLNDVLSLEDAEEESENESVGDILAEIEKLTQ